MLTNRLMKNLKLRANASFTFKISILLWLQSILIRN